MAEEEEKKDGEKSSDPLTDVLGILIIFAIIITLIGRLTQNGWGGIVNVGGGDPNSFFETQVRPLWESLVATLLVFSHIISVFFIVVIIYASTRLSWIDFEWRKQLYPEPKVDTEPEAPRNARWEQVIVHIQSDNPSDWRLAVLEADIVLGDLLDRLAYPGDTIGDRLKMVNKDKFRTIEAAWEAHRIRNAIAHEGKDFILTQREARRIIGLYEQVFREFDFI